MEAKSQEKEDQGRPDRGEGWEKSQATDEWHSWVPSAATARVDRSFPSRHRPLR